MLVINNMIIIFPSNYFVLLLVNFVWGRRKYEENEEDDDDGLIMYSSEYKTESQVNSLPGAEELRHIGRQTWAAYMPLHFLFCPPFLCGKSFHSHYMVDLDV